MTNTDLVKRLRANVCPENMGCGTQPYCSCDAAEEAADAIEALEARLATARETLAHTDIGSLPNDFTLQQVAEARIDDLIKLRDQVRDTCARAEKAEARLATIEAATVGREVIEAAVRYVNQLGAVDADERENIAALQRACGKYTMLHPEMGVGR